MVKNLRVWLGEGSTVVFTNIIHSYVVGNRLFFTRDGMGTNQSGINLDEVIAWEFFDP